MVDAGGGAVSVEPNGFAYDASQIGMRYSGFPDHHWHPAALLQVLAEACSTSPFRHSARFSGPLERRVAVAAAAARLGERGFDLDELVRVVFQTWYVGEYVRLSSRVAYDIANETDALPDFLTPLGKDVLGRVGGPGPTDSFSMYLRQIVGRPEMLALRRRVAGWLAEAELRDLLLWYLPTESELAAVCDIDVGATAGANESQWLVDRFLLTYLSDWHTASLHEEFRWSRSGKVTVVSRELLVLRSVPADRLNAEIAKRAVDGDVRDPRALLMTGVEYLRRGEHEQAVALFQGALAVGQSTWVRNCLAFCLVPSDALVAAEMFRELLAEGFDAPLVYANLAATSRLQNDVGGAHAHARAGLELIDEKDARTAFLWGFEGNAPTLMADVSLYDYLRFVLSWE